MKRFLFGACGALLALGFSACNDETTTVSATSDAEKVSSFKDLDECGSSIVGKLVYVKDSVKAFICTDEGWAAMSAPVKNDSDDKVESSCTVQSIAGGYKVLCDGDSIGVLMNGTKGDSGVQGIQGVQGETGKSAYELSGTDKTLEEWLASLKGDNGKSCTTKKNYGWYRSDLSGF